MLAHVEAREAGLEVCWISDFVNVELAGAAEPAGAGGGALVEGGRFEGEGVLGYVYGFGGEGPPVGERK